MTNFVLLSWILFIAVSTDILKKTGPKDASTEQGGFLLFLFLFFVNTFTGLLISGMYFARHPSLKARILRELKQNFISPVE